MLFRIRGCFRSVCNHPFLVIILCLLLFLYRSSPFIFSILVSISPVLVSTALLLGTLLSLGQSENESYGDRGSHGCVFGKTGVPGDSSIVVEQCGKRTDKEPSLDDTTPLIEGKSREIGLGNGEIWGGNEERFSDDEVVEDNSSFVSMTNVLESGDDKSEADSFDSEMVNVDALDSPRSPWKRMGAREDKDEEDEDEDEDEEDEDEDDDDDVLDSGSEGVESSSPDESMADLMPMLDELHPLLDEEGPQMALLSRNCSVAPSERSMASNESDDEVENNEELEEDNKGEEKKSVITWTAEDQKNLMDLGSSELERNQRLENLILRRRARKNLSMVPDINLIDFESSDLSPSMAPIATRRQNPFDSPHDSYDNCPGSAPSILLPRMNPFDIPYDPSEEKPHLMAGGLQEDHNTTFQSRDPFFRRHESFSVGPSIFAPHRLNERRDMNFRPFFVVPERALERELSDSKLSSAGETESLGSVEHIEDHKLAEEDNVQEVDAVSKNDAVDKEASDSKLSSVAETESLGSVEDIEEHKLAKEEDNVRELDVEQIGHGSQSSSEESSEIEKRDIEIDEMKFQSGDIENHYQGGTVGTGHSRGSSSSSLSKVSEKVFVETESEELIILNGRRGNVLSTLVDEIINRKEPVYDSSPPSVRKNLSTSSSSSDVYAESSDLPPVLVKRTVSFIEKESEGTSREADGVSGKLETLSEHEPKQSGDVNIKDQDKISSSDKNIESSGISRFEEEKANSLISKKEGPILVSAVATGRHSVDQAEIDLSPNSDDVFHEANEKLTCTPSAEGSTSLFYDIGMREPSHFEQRLEEVQVPNTPVGFDEVQNFNRLNIPEIQDLDLDISPNIISPLSPDFISMPSTVSSIANSQIDMHTILEVGDEMKEIDAELDNARNYNLTRWGSCSDEFEKHVYSTGESSEGIVDIKHLKNLSAEIEMDSPGSETTSKKYEARAADSTVNHDHNSTAEAQKVGNIDVSVKQSIDTEIKKPVSVEPTQAVPMTGKTTAENSENGKSQMMRGTANETPALAVRTKEEENGATTPSEGTSLPQNELLDSNTKKQQKQSTDADSIKGEAKPNTDVASVKVESKPNTDVESVKVELKPNTDVESVEVELKPNNEVGSVKVEAKPNSDVGLVEVDSKPNVDVGSAKGEAKPNADAVSEKPDHKVEPDPTISDKEKGDML